LLQALIFTHSSDLFFVIMRGKATMAFCAICGRYHDPGVGCLEGTREILQGAGAAPPPEPAKEGFKRVAAQADRWFVRILVWALVVIVFLFVIASYVKSA
jgi:hypothetical protein